MRKFLLFLVLVTIASMSVSLASDETLICKCVKVYDGDTIAVECEGDELDVRIDAVDCPEMSQDFYDEAKKFTNSLLMGKDLLINIKNQDRYGRHISKVTVGYKDVSLELLKAGMAWHFKRFSDDKTLAAAEDDAKARKIGIWSLPNPVAPWDYRQSFFNQMLPPYQTSADAHADHNSNPTVYINKTGECYHSEGCETLNDGKRGLPLDEVVRHGYRPCRVCNPPVIDEASTP